MEDPQVCYNFSSAVEPLLTDWAAGRSVRGLRTNISVAIKKRLADEIFAAHVTVVSDAHAGPLDFCNDDILTAWNVTPRYEWPTERICFIRRIQTLFFIIYGLMQTYKEYRTYYLFIVLMTVKNMNK